MGVGLRPPYFQDILTSKPSSIGWLEVHPENYFYGGRHVRLLEKIREHYPLSLHAVGLSLGSDQAVNQQHLILLKELCEKFEPFLVSDHASWSASGNAHTNDLLPIPYTKETLNRLADNVCRTQDFLGRTILVENPSTYLSFAADEMSEPAFLNQLSNKTGCSLLLDVNNVYVQAVNHGFDPFHYLDELEMDKVKEVHLAGHIRRHFSGGHLLIDTHNQYICDEVWSLYRYTISKIRKFYTLLEWDSDYPAFKDLLAETEKACLIMKEINKDAA